MHIYISLLITILISGKTDDKNRRMALRNLLLYYFHEIEFFVRFLFIAPNSSTLGMKTKILLDPMF